jgi:hypothetical protein
MQMLIHKRSKSNVRDPNLPTMAAAPNPDIFKKFIRYLPEFPREEKNKKHSKNTKIYECVG